jgi:hypothetical protein
MGLMSGFGLQLQNNMMGLAGAAAAQQGSPTTPVNNGINFGRGVSPGTAIPPTSTLPNQGGGGFIGNPFSGGFVQQTSQPGFFTSPTGNNGAAANVPTTRTALPPSTSTSPLPAPYGVPGTPAPATTPVGGASASFPGYNTGLTPAQQQVVNSGMTNSAAWNGQGIGSYNYLTNLAGAGVNGQANGAQFTPNTAAFNDYWNALTANGSGYNSSIANAIGALSPTQYKADMSSPTAMAAFLAGITPGSSPLAYNGSPNGAFAPGLTGAPQGSNQSYVGQPTPNGGATSPTIFSGGPTQTLGGGDTPLPSTSTNNPSQAQANLAPGLSFLQQIASGQGAGASVNTTPEWQQMVQAMQYNQTEQANNLTAQMAASGNLNSSAYGQSMADFTQNANLQQQSLLAQMQVPAMEQAQQLQAGAGSSLGQIGASAISQLSSQNFQSQMAAYEAQLQSSEAMLNSGSSAASMLDQLSANATTNLNTNAVNAGTGLYSTQIGASNLNAQQELSLMQLGLGTASNLSNIWDSNLSTGASLGNQQYSEQQNAISNAYQQYYATQPEYNPLLSMLYSGATSYPTQAYPSYYGGSLGSLLGGAGSLLGGISQLEQLLGGGNGGNPANLGGSYPGPIIYPPSSTGGGGYPTGLSYAQLFNSDLSPSNISTFGDTIGGYPMMQ